MKILKKAGVKSESSKSSDLSPGHTKHRRHKMIILSLLAILLIACGFVVYTQIRHKPAKTNKPTNQPANKYDVKIYETPPPDVKLTEPAYKLPGI